jgi:hypothetical protein
VARRRAEIEVRGAAGGATGVDGALLAQPPFAYREGGVRSCRVPHTSTYLVQTKNMCIAQVRLYSKGDMYIIHSLDLVAAHPRLV